jgi:SNF2 family DNA or RNA helicase
MWVLKGEPYEVQTVAANRAWMLPGFAYFMEMGLGKTAVVLNEFISLFVKDEVRGLIVVCPMSLKQTWSNEIRNWGLSEKVEVVKWPETPKPKNKPFIWIINYEGFAVGRAKAVLAAEEVMKKYRCMFTLDESISIKKHNGKRTINLIALSKFSPFRRILSGAPVSQGPHDLWAQLRFIGAINNFNYFAFRNKYCKMGGYRGKQIVGAKNEEALNEMLQPHSFRAKKKDWTDLPPKIHTKRMVGLSKNQEKHYLNMKKDFFTEIKGFSEEVSEIEAGMVVTQMMKLQQISSGFIINEEGEAIEIGGKIPKTEAIKELLGEIEGKLIVFAFFRHSVNKLIKDLDEFNPSWIKGQMTEEELQEQKDKFEHDNTSRVIVCQITSAKYGHTLLGNDIMRCSTVAFFEATYDYDARIQAEDRPHRHGQDAEFVLYVDLISSEIEAAAGDALLRKDNVAKAVVDGVKNGFQEGS